MDSRIPPWWQERWLATGLPRPVLEEEATNADYGAAILRIGAAGWRIRTARVTPTKPGGFVSAWRRGAAGETEPFFADSTIAGMIVFVEDAHRRGAFIWDTDQLTELGILHSPRHPGKRGFRVYPAWCSELNAQAQTTQRRQSAGFVEYLGGRQDAEATVIAGLLNLDGASELGERTSGY
ncbi:metallopeptidase [Mycetocola tolaasinivorans]|uniref:Metallopeptidase n=1 Tax=Mycetocola tolaasinivorans TaxID=76635 RepID=A0A3L7ACK1_9MICO|nr:MepB family protein [Mycetocola tolaasinivorans]RLP77540.1 metallopeptidase [Mycetocola tolaasinivorans]